MIPYTGGTIGRVEDCEIFLDDVNVSKKHAKFGYNEDEKAYTIVDLGSRNGTFIHSVILPVGFSKRIFVSKFISLSRSVFRPRKKLATSTS